MCDEPTVARDLATAVGVDYPPHSGTAYSLRLHCVNMFLCLIVNLHVMSYTTVFPVVISGFLMRFGFLARNVHRLFFLVKNIAQCSKLQYT